MWYANSVKTGFGTDRKNKRVKPKKRSPSQRSVQKYVWPDGNPVQPIVARFDPALFERSYFERVLS